MLWVQESWGLGFKAWRLGFKLRVYIGFRVGLGLRVHVFVVSLRGGNVFRVQDISR